MRVDVFDPQGRRVRSLLDDVVAPIVKLALADGQAAIAYVRTHAKEYGVNPDRIGIIGFSAGGEGFDLSDDRLVVLMMERRIFFHDVRFGNALGEQVRHPLGRWWRSIAIM